MARRNAREMVAFRARGRADAAMARIGMTTASMRGGGDAANVVALKIVQNSRNLVRSNISEAVARRALTTDVVPRRLAGIAAQRIATSTGLPLPIARMVARPGRALTRAALVGGALAGATYLMTRGARAETAALRPTAGSSPGGGLDISGTTAVVAGVTAGAGYAGYRMLRRPPVAPPAVRTGLLISQHVAGLRNAVATGDRLMLRGYMTRMGATPTQVAGFTARALGPTPMQVVAQSAPVSGLRRAGGLLRRAALPLTALAVVNEASRGFSTGGAAGAVRGAGNALTFGALDMVAGAAPARPATANSSAHTAAVAGATGASVNATAAIAQASQGSTAAMPGVAVSSDGMTAGYARTRRLASGLTVHEQVASYATPGR